MMVIGDFDLDRHETSATDKLSSVVDSEATLKQFAPEDSLQSQTAALRSIANKQNKKFVK
jgi:hypothetical protein